MSRFHRLAAQIAQNETEFKIPYIEGRSIKLCILDQKLAETRSGSRSQFTKPGDLAHFPKYAEPHLSQFVDFIIDSSWVKFRSIAILHISVGFVNKMLY